MPQDAHEFQGKTVDDAIATGLTSLGLTRSQVEIEIVSKGSRGILGFGSELARVRMIPLPATTTTPQVAEARSAREETRPVEEAPPSPKPPAEGADDGMEAEKPESDTARAGVTALPRDEREEGELEDAEWSALAADLLSQMVQLMGFEAEVEARWHDPDEEGDSPYLHLNLVGDELGALIGRRGETLANIQYLLRLMVNQRIHAWKNIVVDVEQYKERRVVQLSQLAQRMAKQVVETGRPIVLEPMPANERRIVHITLRDHPDVYTASFGEGERRKVEIIPKS